VGKKHEKRRALLIANSKSGPKNDSLLYVRQIVELLQAHGIDTKVRVKLRRKQAIRYARRAAREGTRLVIAAGGDGTIEAVAAGLRGSDTVLGIVPLGTYNNVASCLGVPTDVAQACALIATADARSIDVGVARARSKRGKVKRRVFLEHAFIGWSAALVPAGQEAKDRAWDTAAQALATAFGLSPVAMRIELDEGQQTLRATTLLVEIANTPRSGAAITFSPEAKMDDGQFDVAIHRDAGQATLALRMLARKAGSASIEASTDRLRASRVYVKTTSPLPVSADSKVIGTTPAKMELKRGALRVITGAGPALVNPASEGTVATAARRAESVAPPPPKPDPLTVDPEPSSPVAIVASAVVPVAGKAAAAAEKARPIAIPALAAAAGAAALPILRLLAHRLRG